MNADATAEAADPFRDAALVQVRLGDGIISHLSQAILDGRLRPGERLPSEAQLALRYGVSKPIVREAIRQLAAQGVLQVGQGRPTQVRALDAEPLGRFWRFAAGGSAEGLAEAVELRRVVEPAVARLAAQRWRGDQLEHLRAVLDTMQEARGDVPRWIPADLEFHDALARMAHNRLLLLQVRGMMPVIRDIMGRFNRRATRTAADWDATWQRHAAVAHALAARDPARAEHAMLLHFAAADAEIAQLFPGGPPTASHERPAVAGPVLPQAQRWQGAGAGRKPGKHPKNDTKKAAPKG